MPRCVCVCVSFFVLVCFSAFFSAGGGGGPGFKCLQKLGCADGGGIPQAHVKARRTATEEFPSHASDYLLGFHLTKHRSMKHITLVNIIQAVSKAVK